MPTHLANEVTLVAEAQAGNAEAFTTLVNQYDRNIYRVALSITGNQADAEDVLQETFLKAYTRLRLFQGHSRFYTWLVRIAINEALMELRRRRAGRSIPLDQPIETGEDELPREIEGWDENPEELYAQQELREILAEALERLEPASRSVFVLRDVEDLSTAETAALLNLSVSAVKSRLMRARLELRERLNKYFMRPVLVATSVRNQ